jgi:trichothecene 3-O-acetyltransferase
MASRNDMLHIPLGPLDHIAPCNIPQSIIYLGLKRNISPKDAFTCLREGLRQTILQAPWLSGRVYLQSRDSPGWRSGQLEIRYVSMEHGREISQTSEIPLRFNELPTSTSFAELREAGFPLDVFDDEVLLWTSPFEPDFESGAEVFSAQANFVPGGCLLVLSIAAPASDGTAMLNVTKLWADHCRSLLHERQDKPATGNQSVLPLPAGSVDRAALDTTLAKARDLSKLLQTSDKHQASDLQRLVGVDGCDRASKDASKLDDSADTNVGLGASHDIYQAPDMKPSIFYMPQPMYTELRKELAAVHNTADVSGNDVICAFIWRSIIRAWTAVRAAQQKADVGETATLAIPFDARPDVSHLLPASYLGNLNFEHIFTLPLRTLISQGTSIPWVAKMIRTNAMKQAHQHALLEAYGLLRSVPEYEIRHVQIRASRMSSQSASVGILSPMVLPFNDTCFGEHVFANGGRPEAFRPMMGICNREYRTCFVIPRKQHGGIEFVMTLSEEETDFLRDDDEFSRYAFSIS